MRVGVRGRHRPRTQPPEAGLTGFFCKAVSGGYITTAMAKKPPDNQWFIEQVEQQQSALKGFIRMLGVRPESVDDLAQETFVIAYKKLEMFEQGTNFGAWLRTIARNLVRNEIRRQSRRRVLATEVAEFLLDRADEKATHPAAQVEQAEQHKQRVAALRACLRKLPKRSRRIVKQRYFEQLSLGVIAGYENTNANNISQILFRLRSSLFSCMKERLGDAST